MRCIIVLLNILISTLCLARNYNLRLSPICIVKGDRVEKPCAHFKERPLEKLPFDTWTEQPINKTERGDHYANISISFSRKYDINPILVVLRYEDSPLPEKTWEVRPVSREIIGFPSLVTVAFAPTSTNQTRYQIRRIVNPSRPLDDASCNKTETHRECYNLKNSKLFIKKKMGHSLSITMSGEIASSSLTVDVLSAHCNITCRGDINPCSSVEIRNLQWENPTEELKIYNTENSSDTIYYCARISPAYHECCMIYTETVYLSPDYPRRISVAYSQKIYLPKSFIVLSVSLTLLISIMFAVRKIFGDSSHKCWPYNNIRPPQSSEDGLLNPSHETTPSKINTTPSHVFIQPVEVEVLLIYPRESDTLEKLMIKFRHILSSYVTKVWDPLDDLEIEKVSENPNMWLDSVLSRNNVKVILVEDSGISEWYESCRDGEPAFRYHHLDGLFLYSLSVLHNNPYLCYDYRKLFIIRFSSLNMNTKSTNIVPCTRYEIPRNFHKLITDLVGSSVTNMQSEFQPPLKEMEELELIIFEYGQEKRIHQEQNK
ncbi:uncharacterized protein [Halyomorpha halys]|uniref:uncharacterized protein n=1 Tax=Halyomorpha halys TaxID=286706 RepID=UPI0006D4D6FC|nr:uncharacterized protein LOC106680078 [Halyomorpha halys]XP_014275034.1 uncharacterized protein LOC106680078 [Halyomorpha halys]XP_014275035.1 uncharacterized protein LOC106680078 [Halyomorpha halys]XP_014275036.1 uncharacterized protein LOC106680078 [Halyomorpha halys]XP_014275037.1 uncharacterized protein LOC106680078 [Halyomorpha halys]XP_014275038.1 uncharacterized protein LOC106680078 [Halyomorpha halys]XP_014275039.1 uncharacterized protein LOC106680078 [Halyomorpha halys]XP_01427504